MDFDLVLRDVRLDDSTPDQPTTDIGAVQDRIAAIAPKLGGGAREEFKGGRHTVTRTPVELHRP